MSDFAKNLKKYRKRKKYSQKELAEKVNYGYTTIANYESGRNEPSLDTLITLAKALDVTVDELVGMKLETTERKLLSAFKKIDPRGKKIITELLDVLSS